MSHRAVVAIEHPGRDDQVSLHHSQHGADGLLLYPHLVDFYSRTASFDIGTFNEQLRGVETSVDSVLQSTDNEIDDAPAIEPDPFEENIQPGAIGEHIDFVKYEAVYYLETSPSASEPDRGAVTVLLPAFVDVVIAIFFTRYVKLEVYPKSHVEGDYDDVANAVFEESLTPEFVIEGEDYFSIESTTEPLEVLVDSHMGILQMLYSVSAAPEEDEVLTMIVSEDHYVIGRIDTSSEVPLPIPTAAGVLIRLPSEDLRYPQLTNLYRDWKYLVNKLRISHSVDAFEGFLEASHTGQARDFSTEHAEARLLRELNEEFTTSISDLSPDSYLDRIRSK